MSRLSRRFASRLWLHLAGVLLLAASVTPQNPLLTLVAPNPAAPRVAAAEAMNGPTLPPTTTRKVAPPADPTSPGLAVMVAVTPDPAQVNTPITVTITVTNQSPRPATDLVVTLPVPDGAEPLPGPGLVSPIAGWRWTQMALPPGGKAAFTAMLRMGVVPTGDALVAVPSVTAKGLSRPVSVAGGAIVESPARATTSRAVSTDAAAAVMSSDGRVRVDVPARVGTAISTVAHSHTPPAGEKAAPARYAGRGRGFGVFFLSATDAAGQSVHRLPAPVTVTLRYTPEQLRALGIAEANLSLFWYDPDATWPEGGPRAPKGRWIAVPTVVDRKARTATAQVEHFSQFTHADGSSLTDAFTPSIEEWQVSSFTGGVAYSLPIGVPGGPVGLKPDLRLGYNSAQTDGASGERPMQQAGWAGKGWSLDPGAISTLRTPDGTFAGYTLALSGRAYDLYRGQLLRPSATPLVSDYEWKTSDESFLRVRAEYLGETDPARASNQDGTFHRYKWHLWTKDGLHYEFEDDAWWGFKYCGGQGEPSFGWMEAYTWKLSRVTDTHGNGITYTYDRTPPESDPNGCYGLVGTVDKEIWLTAVTWGGPQCRPTPGAALVGCHQMRFTSWPRAYDTAVEFAPVQYGPSPTQTRVLAAVDVYSWPTGAPMPETPEGLAQNRVRSYYLGYDDGSRILLSDSSFGNAPDPTTPKYTLTSVTLTGRDGTTATPTTTFTYGIDRGSAPAPNGDWNRLTKVDNGQGGSVAFTYESIGVQHPLFNNYRRVTKKTVSDGRTAPAEWLYRYSNPELNTVGRSIDTLRPPEQEPQYSPNSAALYLNRYWLIGYISYDFNVLRRQNTEFRGHRTSTEIAPNGRQIVQYFYQGDTEDDPRDPAHGCAPNPVLVNGDNLATYNNDPCFQLLRDNEFRVGRAYRTEVRGPESAGSPLLSRSERTYALDQREMVGVRSEFGLWHAWVYLQQEVETVFENGEGTASKTTTTQHEYDPGKQGGTQYGDRTDVRVYTGVPAPNDAPYRRTERWYAARDTAAGAGTTGAYAAATYLAGHAWQSQRADGAGAAVTKHQTFYDGLGAGQIGTRGETSRTRAFYDLGAGLGRDEAFEHDAWGNVRKVTSFAGANAAGAARETTMTYDGVFHARLTGVTLPAVGSVALTESAEYDPVLGVLTKITDPNNAVTTATYDALGRIEAVVSPGGSATNPTLRYLYRFGTATAPGLVVSIGSVGTHTLRYSDGRGRAIQTKTLTAASGSYRSVVTDTAYDAMGYAERTSQPRYVTENGTAFWEYTAQGDAATMRWTVTQRDVRARATQVTAPDGSYGTASYAIGALGPAVTATDANRHQTRREEDIWGRLREVVEYTGDGAGTPYTPYATTKYTYDVRDLLLTEEDDRHNVTSNTYDGLSRVLSSTSSDRGLSTAAYDVNGNVTSTVDANMNTIGYGYDALNRLVSMSGGVTASYLYDRDPAYPGESNTLGRLVTSTTGPASTPVTQSHTTFDARGRAVTARTTTGGTMATFGYAYDDGNRVTTLTYPGATGTANGESVTYTYDLASRPLSLCAGSTCYAGNADYTALSQPTTRTLGNTTLEQWTYDGPLARLARHQIGTAPTSPSSRDDRRYAYDAGGNVTTITNGSGEEQRFTYDARDRLVRAMTTGPSTAPYDETYSYDTVGNLLSKAGVAYDYAGSGHANAPKTVGGDTYTYDATGNTVSGGGRTYEWNAQGLPQKITVGAGTGAGTATPPPGAAPNLAAPRGGATVPGVPNLAANRAGGGGTSTPAPNLVAPARAGGAGITEEYAYSAGGTRVARTHEGVTTRYFGLWEVDVQPNTATVVATRAYYRFGGIVAQRERRGGGDTAVYLHGDHLGSVSTVTGASGDLVSKTEYGPWGQVRGSSTGSKPTAIDYTGQLRDGTGLLAMGARYYDPVLGRFISADTVRDGVNPYAYVRNNPLRFTDPTGHSWADAALSGVAAGAGEIIGENEHDTWNPPEDEDTGGGGDAGDDGDEIIHEDGGDGDGPGVHEQEEPGDHGDLDRGGDPNDGHGDIDAAAEDGPDLAEKLAEKIDKAAANSGYSPVGRDDVLLEACLSCGTSILEFICRITGCGGPDINQATALNPSGINQTPGNIGKDIVQNGTPYAGSHFPTTGQQPYEIKYRTTPDGRVEAYGVYDSNGNLDYRVDLQGPKTGREHTNPDGARVPTPHLQPQEQNTNSAGQVFVRDGPSAYPIMPQQQPNIVPLP